MSSEYAISFRLNNFGCKDIREYSFASHEGTFRILALGDSFTEGDGAMPGETFPALLEQQFNGTALRPVEVYNLGVRGEGDISFYRMQLERVLDGFKPDLIVYNLYVGNDLQDVYAAGSGARRLIRLLPVRVRSLIFRVAMATREWRTRSSRTSSLPSSDHIERAAELVERSRALARVPLKGQNVASPLLVRNVAAMRAWRPDRDQALVTYLRNAPLHVLTGCAKGDPDWCWYLFDAYVYPRPYAQDGRPYAYPLHPDASRLTLFQSVLDDTLRILGNTPVIVVLIPSPSQVSKEFILFRRSLGYDIPDTLLTDRRIQDQLAAILERKGIPYLDLLPALRQQDEPDVFFWIKDGHFSLAGHRVVSRLLFDFLTIRWETIRRHRL